MDSIDPQLRIDSVALAVSDLERSARFYEDALGLPLLSREAGAAWLGPDHERPALELRELSSPTQLSPRSTGLFHVAWLHPSRAALADTVHRLAASGWPLEGASDHGVSEALYLSDPDGLGIEIYADRPRASWERPAGGNGVRMFTAPLDLRDLLAQVSDDPAPSIAPGSGVGHVHLKVSDVPRALRFYTDELGFEEQAEMPSAAFVSAGGYHHHVGLNSWQSAGAEPPPDSAPGLREVRFALSGPERVHELAGRVGGDARAGGGGNGSVSVRDPDGQVLTFSAR